MALLNLHNPFTMTVNNGESEKELNGFFRDFTKTEKTNFEKKHKKIDDSAKEAQKLLKQVRRAKAKADIKQKQEDYDAYEKALEELYKLEDKLEQMNETFIKEDAQKNLLKERFKICLGGEDAEEITKLAEVNGYEKVFKVIQESIAEFNEGKQES